MRVFGKPLVAPVIIAAMTNGAAVERPIPYAYFRTIDLYRTRKPTISLKGLPDIDGDDSWEPPLAATYVIAPDRRIALSEIELDHRERLEPEAIVAALRNRTGE